MGAGGDGAVVTGDGAVGNLNAGVTLQGGHGGNGGAGNGDLSAGGHGGRAA